MVGFEEARAAYEADGGRQLERITGHPLPPRPLKKPVEMDEKDYPF